jgi:hypothetical protein
MSASIPNFVLDRVGSECYGEYMSMSNADTEVLTLADECPICFRDTKQVTCARCGQREVTYSCDCWYGDFIRDAEGRPVHGTCPVPERSDTGMRQGAAH